MHSNNCNMNNIILDVDGVIWIGGSPGPGAIEFLNILSNREIPFCLLTNDCSASKSDRHKSLIKAGLIMEPEQLVTAVEVTREWLRNANIQSIMYLGAANALSDLTEEFSVCNTAPVDAVVVGDLFAHFDRGAINRAAKAVIEGAKLVAMQRNPRWFDGTDWYVDNGFWVAGFEYVTGKKAVLVGKPHRIAYQSALARLGLSSPPPLGTFFVSDDMMYDLKGAKNVGLTTIYFGSTNNLPPWVDHTVSDFNSLKSLLIGDKYE